ncbi:MAG: hypothetical protein A3E36_00970 [Candidatus Andersenbacteria bacterium RIFCSPHIGHO2_12_FULL_45_11b]|uniref:CDP-archaeol synthase n=1 Tax=Candidatus Andersenbacteria bacterium RIFCSPHIGHO2_12_FULL_45_11b TaxID=1797282 RepID=A0A1G1XAZ6_9BACT|nr:MAG: hypothetical protein A3E36_00970 [Candidatus Andersenbacteria bacterium RIFCSPHIGHO2_12_FULL_45_11b]
MNIVSLIQSVVWIYAPAMVANMAPIFAAKWNMLPWLNRPLDFGVRVRGGRLFGSHKTLRGVVVALFAGALTGMLQAIIIHQEILAGAFVGAVFGFGAIAGDAIKSFFKRRLRVAPGARWFPFDQIDFVIGATITGMFFVHISLPIFIIAVIGIGIASYVASFVGVALHFKKTL